MTWRRIFNLLVWLGLLAGASVAVGLALTFYHPGATQFPKAEALPPATVRTAERNIREVRQGVKGLGRSAPQAHPTPFTFRLRDKDINTFFAAHPEELHRLHPNLRAMEVRFSPGERLSLQALGTYRGREILVRVEGQVTLSETRQLSFTVQEAHLGALPLPPVLRQKATEQINRALANQLKDLPSHVRLESFSTTEGELNLQGEV